MYSHLQGLINLLQILNLKKIKKFIQIGSSAEYGKIKSPIKEKLCVGHKSLLMQLQNFYVQNI